MSRIEEAMEKAAKMRDSRNDAASGAPKPPPPPPVHLPPPAPVVGLKVTNQLLVAASDPLTPVAEEYRKLKSILVRLTKGETFRNMLMVTSSISNEGKSITSLNLAMALAQEYDHTVLLVDADLRKPSIHTYLGIKQQKGLSECLLDGLDIKEALIGTGIGRLSLLPAGRQVSNPTELFSSQKSRDFFLEIKHRYHDRYIIIDTPPVLPFAETRSMNSVMDGVVLVVKEGAVPLQHITETLECLKGGEILGIVFNEASLENHSGHYHYYRGGYAEAV